MITELTEDQKNLMPIVRDEWISRCLDGDTSINEVDLKEGINYLYAKINLPPPSIEIVGSPFEAQARANLANGTNEYYPMGIGLGQDAGWTAFYDFFQRIGIVKNSDFDVWLRYLKSGCWDILACENICYAVRRPKTIKRDKDNKLHNPDGLAISWVDSSADKFGFYWHGTRVPPKLIMDPGSVTRDEILAEKNTEVSRAYAERLGWARYFELADMEKIDSWLDPITNLTYELYDFKTRLGDFQPRLLKMESPQLNDGTRPFYVEPVPPEIKSAQAARKWQQPKSVGKNGIEWHTPVECNNDPSLHFAVES